MSRIVLSWWRAQVSGPRELAIWLLGFCTILWLIAAAVSFAGCGAPARGIGTSPSMERAAREVETRYVSCMAEPPPFEDIDWPTPDSVGNVLMHASTVDRVKGAYATLRRYASEQYFRCLHVAEAAGETSVTVEQEP